MKYGYLIDPDGKCTGRCKIPDTLEGYYKLLDCEFIDIVSRQIDGKYFDFVCDDEGRLKDHPKVSACGSTGVMFVGKILVCNHDGEGNEVGLTAGEFKTIVSHVKVNSLLTGVEY